ncbi:MAG: sulfatase [FCB group bacterium]|jgi:arylsulfatase A-like enzyme|nr:sulfatase [FCB group bacterium]
MSSLIDAGKYWTPAAGDQIRNDLPNDTIEKETPMKAIMLMFDSLNRRMLEPYGCDWVKTPNFTRLAERAITFTNSYVGSLPCMPARRELHTGRYNFLHRSWGPIEPFDDSMPEILKKNGIYSHLATDHYHYWEDGGATYHTRYSSWECSRGQENDAWKGVVRAPERPKHYGQWTLPNQKNRPYMAREEDQPQPKTFAMGMEFLRTNHAEDNWFLHLETFDPHEPYFVPERFQKMYPHGYKGPHFDWPLYHQVDEPAEAVEHCRLLSAALHTMCDEYLGRVLDLMDELDLWKDTLLIVNTDHGFLLGEHNWWAKVVQPCYNEVAHTPLFIWDPRSERQGERCDALVQTIDLPATVLEYFNIPLPPDMQGTPLRETVARDTPVREAALFGVHGGQVNVTDGRYVYMRALADSDNSPLYEYTHMPTRMVRRFTPDELKSIELAEPFTFTKGCKTMKIPGPAFWRSHQYGTMLFDLQADPYQERPIEDAAVEQRMIAHMVRLMRWNDAPPEQYQRLGLPAEVPEAAAKSS